VTLAYDRAGAGPALVLLHALGGDRQMWRPLLPYLEPHRDVIRVDLPGFGASPPLDGDPDPAALGAAVRDLLAALDLDRGRAHVAGNSLGGWVALEMAAAGDAASVTAIAPAGLWRRPLAPKPAVARRLARLARPVLGPLLRSARGRRLALGGTIAHPERVPAADAAALARAYASAPGFVAVNRAMRAGMFTRLADIDVPVTLVWPEHDRLIAPVRDAPANVRQVALPDAGHVPMWDAPQAVAAVLLEGSGG
jgi:pimeloyl-ACP methyl ester carboxylesterase